MADRMCDSCGQVDDHPRHVHGLGPGEEPTPHDVAIKALKAGADSPDFEAIVAHIQDKATQVKHLDCCKADGCPDGSCDLILSGDIADLKGTDLKAVLTSGSVDRIGKELNDARLKEAEAAS